MQSHRTIKNSLLITAIIFTAITVIVSVKYSKKIKPAENQTFSRNLTLVQPAKDFYKKQCAFCHTNEELIAPDMNKIKAVYLEKYKTKDAFIQAVSKFVKNPDKKNSLYKEGIENFMDMPKMPFKDEQIKAVAEYIYESSDL